MILNKTELKRILLENPTKKIWDSARKDSKSLQMHVLGHGLQEFITKIELHESTKGETVRKKYAKSNRDLFARTLRPIDNIWNGRGGGRTYLTNEANEKQIRQISLDIYKGFSLPRWVEKFWRPRYIDDPMGLVFMEVSESMPNKVYPTYKASKEIYDALPSGRSLEYIIFKTEEPDIFRVVDDSFDYLVKLSGAGDDARVTELSGKKYPRFVNWFEKVPALIVSDLPADGQDGYFMSPIKDEIELADQFLRDGSIANVYRFKHGFPKSWKYPEVCGTCKGQKAVNGQPCGSCNGSGIKLTASPDDISVYAWPTKDEPEIRDKGGFISPDLEYLKYSDESLQILEELITRTHWGTDREKSKSGQETATGRFIDTQPVINRLKMYAEAAESVETFITNHIGFYHFATAWKGATVNLGRRFLIESVDAVWKKYEEARKSGAPLVTLTDLLREYYETKYQGNPQELQKSLILIQLEPGVHLTLAEAKDALPWLEYYKKVYINDFISQKLDIQLAVTPLPILRQELETFTLDKVNKIPVNPLAPDISSDPADPAKKKDALKDEEKKDEELVS